MKLVALMSFYWIGIFSYVLQCYCQENDSLTVIYAVENQVFAKEFGGHNLPKELENFEGHVTGLAMYNDYLYISEARSGFFTKNSRIWRIKKLTNSTSFEIDKSSKETIHVVSADSADILSMVIANGFIYAGRSDGVMWRCSTDKQDSCKDFNVFKKKSIDTSITSIDYNPADGNIYTVERVFEYSSGKLSYLVKSCQLDTVESCNLSYSFYNYKITAFKIAFDTIWFGTETGKLLKCPKDENCLEVDDFERSGSLKIYALDKYLYLNVKSGNYTIWRCDPNSIEPCSKEFEVSDADYMGPFIIV